MATQVKATLATALVKAQTDLHAPAKNRTVNVPGKYKFDYATLDEITERVLRPVLPGHGLWFVQGVKDGHMVTTIVHDSGETMDAGQLPMSPPSGARPQEFGSLITYYKRYSLCAAFGLVADEDDDGTAVTGQAYETTARKSVANDSGLKTQLQQSVKQASKDAPFPQGPAKNKTDLKNMGRDLWRDVLACEDAGQLDALVASSGPLIKQLRDALPDWWNGGSRDGEAYEGLGTVIVNRQTEFANDAWTKNPVSAG